MEDAFLFATMVVLMVEFAQILTLAGVHLIGGMDLPVNNLSVLTHVCMVIVLDPVIVLVMMDGVEGVVEELFVSRNVKMADIV